MHKRTGSAIVDGLSDKRSRKEIIAKMIRKAAKHQYGAYAEGRDEFEEYDEYAEEFGY